jgi:hypothetical protein
MSLPALAQGGEWGSRGISRRFAVLGDTVFAADGRGITTYDVSTPASPRVIDFDTTGNETSDLAIVSGSPAHVVAATTRGLDWYRVDGNSLAGPVAMTEGRGSVTRVAANSHLAAAVIGENVLVYELNAPDADLVAQYAYRSNKVLAVAFVGDVLFVSVDREGTYVYDVPDFDYATKLNVAPIAFALSGNTLWGAAPDTGLTAINVQTPTAAEVIGSAGSGEYVLDGVAALGTRIFTFERGNLIRVFDATDPTKPTLVMTKSEWVNVLAASVDRLFLAGAIIDSEKLSSETGKPLRVFDANTLALLGERSDYAGPVSGVWTDGSLAYVIDPPYLRVMDVSKSAQPRVLSSIAVPQIQDQIRVKNGLAVIYGRTLVNLLDVSDPLHPRHIGSWNTQGHPESFAAIARDTFLEANPHSGFHVVDYSNPSAPVQVGGRKWHYYSIAAGDDAAYLLLYGVFLTVQIANGNTVIDKTKYQIVADQLDVVPPNSSAPYALVLRTQDGIGVYSLAERFVPQQTAFIPAQTPGLMATGDDDAYVTMGGILHRLNVAAPAALVATDMKVLSPMQISVAGEKVVIADRYSLRVYGPDTDSPELPPPPPPPIKPSKRRSVG